MKNKLWGFLGLCFLLSVSFVNQGIAGTAIITFDELAPLNGSCLSEEYSSLGVHFMPTLTKVCSASTYNTPWEGISSGTNGSQIMASPGIVEPTGQKSAGFVIEFDYPVHRIKIDFTIGPGTTSTEALTYFMIKGNAPVGLGSAPLPGPNEWKTLNLAPDSGSTFTAIVVFIAAGNSTAGFLEIFAGFDNLVIDADTCFPTTAEFSASPTIAYVGTPVDFYDASADDVTSWEWDFGDGETSSVQNPTHVYSAPGKYTVGLTVISDCGETDAISRADYITIEKVPEVPPTADFEGAPTKGSIPHTVYFADASEYATSWLWDFGDGTTSTLKNPSHEYTEVGLFTVSLTVSNPYGDDSITREEYIEVSADAYRLYFPYIITNEQWTTKATIINGNQENSLAGLLYYYNSVGEEVLPSEYLDVRPNGREDIEIIDPTVKYLIFWTRHYGALGYTEFSINGRARAAVPAIDSPSKGALYMHHLVSQEKWESRLALVNTTDMPKAVILDMDGVPNRLVRIPPRGQFVTTIGELFKAYKLSDIRSGVIINAAGIVGIELFEGLEEMYGIVLNDSLSQTIYYPHVADEEYWDTGVVFYNPWNVSCDVTLTAYAADGSELGSNTYSMGFAEKVSGIWRRVGCIDDAEWFRADATLPITGFESLFSTAYPQAGGFNTVGLTAKKGVLGKIEGSGRTEMVLVNVSDEPAAVTLTAYDDGGNIVATENVTINAKEKLIDKVENLFSTDIAGATHVVYSSDQELSGCEVSGSADTMRLDALPAL